MAQLWGGRFTKQTDAAVKAFNDSIGFDRRLYRQDITGSMAHARMLGRQGILTQEDCQAILDGLEGILKDIESGALPLMEQESGISEYEDIHSFVEANLIDRIGDAGKRLHTGRSRNDQVALDMRLYTREAADEIRSQVLGLLHVILDLMEEHSQTWMPGFTHLQKAQPTTLAHHLGAYFEMLRRDYGRITDCRNRMNECPLGAGALAGTTYPLDRAFVASELSFDCETRNSMDSVSDRDYLLEFLSDLSILMMHLSRFSEELIIWNSNEYRFVEMDDAFSTGSSIMPQKKNPDICELVRGKVGRVYGDLMSLLTAMKGLPLAYNKDMQEDKEPAFDAIDTAQACIPLFAEMLRTITFRKEVMEKSAMRGFTNATDAADYLVGKGVPFRDAHGMIGRLVLHCLDAGKAIEELPLEELKEFSPQFEQDVYDAISLRTCVNRRLTTGAPGEEAMKEEIAASRAWLQAQEN